MLSVAPIINKDNINQKQREIVWVPTQTHIRIPVIQKNQIESDIRVRLKNISPIKDNGVIIDDTDLKFLVLQDNYYTFKVDPEVLELKCGVYMLEVLNGGKIVLRTMLLINY